MRLHYAWGNRLLHSGEAVGLVEAADLPGGSHDSARGAARIQIHLGLRRASARRMEEPDCHRTHDGI